MPTHLELTLGFLHSAHPNEQELDMNREHA